MRQWVRQSRGGGGRQARRQPKRGWVVCEEGCGQAGRAAEEK